MQTLFPIGQLPSYLYATYKSTAKINYLTLPVLVKYYYYLKRHWHVYIAAGPFASIVLSAKNETSGSSNIYLDQQENQPLTSSPQSFDNTKKIKKNLHAWNTGINGHVGIGYKFKSSSLFLEGGGNYGLVDIQKNAKNKTGAGTVTFGYQFRIKK